MENNKKIQIGLLGIIALLLIANLFGGGMKNWFQPGNSAMKEASLASGAVANGDASLPGGVNSGNIPGTNVNENGVPMGPTTTIQYDQEKFNFGVIDEGEIVKHIYKFKNTGNEPLIISNAKGSCGCTVPTWPKEPVPPGGTGEIAVEFNSKGKPGQQMKKVTVTANTNPTETFLEIAGEVRGKEQPAAKGADAGVGQKLTDPQPKKPGSN